MLTILRKCCSCLSRKNNSQQMKKKKSCIVCADLGTLFYGLISLTFHVISVSITIKQIKQLIIAVIVDLSLSMTQNSTARLSDSNHIPMVISIYRNNTISSIRPRQFITNQFIVPIIFLIGSILFSVGFAICVFFKIGNVANDSLQLGNDLILIDIEKSVEKEQNKNDLLPLNENGKIEKTIPHFNLTSKLINNENKYCLSYITNHAQMNVIDEQDESEDNLIIISNSSPTISSPASSSPLASSRCDSSSPPPSSSSAKSQTMSSDEFSNSTCILNNKTTRAQPASYNSNLIVNNKNKKNLFKYFYLPSLSSCFHLMMCFCLLVSRLTLDKFKLNYDLTRQTPTNFAPRNQQMMTNVLASLNLTNQFNISTLNLFKFYYNNLNRHNLTQANMKTLLNDIKMSRVEEPALSLDTLMERTSNMVNGLLELSSKLRVDLNYLSYLIAFMVFALKFTRVYSNINRLYASLIFTHIILYALLNFTTFPAFEAIYKNQSPLSMLSKSKNANNMSGLNGANSSLLMSNFVSNMNLMKLLPNLFENEAFMLCTYVSSWLMNLFYFSSLNAFLIAVYREAQARIRMKYENYLKECGKKQSDEIELRQQDEPLSFVNTNAFTLDKQNRQDASSSFEAKNSNVQVQILYTNHQNRVKSQYKAIISGIFVLLLTEICRLPFVYSCYIKYFLYNSDVYLMALVFQLFYLLYNALFWIILSFKTEWIVKFSPQFRILLWHHLYSEYFYKKRKMLMDKYFAKNNLLNNTTSTRVSRLDDFSTFEDCSHITNINLENKYVPNKRLMSNAVSVDMLRPKSIAKLKQNKQNSLKHSKIFMKNRQKNGTKNVFPLTASQLLEMAACLNEEQLKCSSNTSSANSSPKNCESFVVHNEYYSNRKQPKRNTEEQNILDSSESSTSSGNLNPKHNFQSGKSNFDNAINVQTYSSLLEKIKAQNASTQQVESSTATINPRAHVHNRSFVSTSFNQEQPERQSFYKVPISKSRKSTTHPNESNNYENHRQQSSEDRSENYRRNYANYEPSNDPANLNILKYIRQNANNKKQQQQQQQPQRKITNNYANENKTDYSIILKKEPEQNGRRNAELNNERLKFYRYSSFY